MLNQKKFDKLIALAKEACELGYLECGTGWKTLAVNIKTYTSVDTHRHQAATFSLGIFNEIKVSLFSVPDVEVTSESLRHIDAIIAGVESSLASLKAEMAVRDINKVEAERQARINGLEQELADLKGARE